MTDRNYPLRGIEPRVSRRSLLMAGGVLFTVPILGACGEDEATNEPGNGGETGQPGGNLTFGIAVPFGTFDPYQHLTTNFVAFKTFYDYLVEYDKDMKPQPLLAESWQLSEDNTEATISLREATFHSGNPVTAADIVAGIERAKNPEIGLSQVNAASFIETSEAVDDRTVRVVFNGAWPEAELTDWMNNFPVVEASGNDPEALKSAPAGSGPFQFDALSPGKSLTMTKNPEYWDEGKPYLDSAEVRFFDDHDALASALQAGDVAGATYLGGQYHEQLSAQFEVTVGATDALVDIFYMNPTKAPFDNADVRRALARAINRERIIEAVRFGLGEPAYAPLGTTSAAFDESYLDEYGYDLAAAEQMLAAAGGERTATALVQPAPGVSEIMQIIQADFEKIGFTLNIEPVEQATFVERIGSGDLQACISAGGNGYLTPNPTGRPTQVTNNTFWGEEIPEDYVAAVNAAMQALTPEDQEQAFKDLNEAYMQHSWAIGIATRPSVHAFASNVAGTAFDQGDHVVLTEATVS